jgi:hypothetical protein
MRIRNALARVRAAWAAADRQRWELEQHIASYNVPPMTRAERADLDRALDEILGRQGGERSGRTGPLG